jgi:hypothetical protein
MGDSSPSGSSDEKKLNASLLEESRYGNADAVERLIARRANIDCADQVSFELLISSSFLLLSERLHAFNMVRIKRSHGVCTKIDQRRGKPQRS